MAEGKRMNAGSEFLFWLILFAEILGVWAIYGLVCHLKRYRDVKRENARLRFELGRHQVLLHYRSESARRTAIAR